MSKIEMGQFITGKKHRCETLDDCLAYVRQTWDIAEDDLTMTGLERTYWANGKIVGQAWPIKGTTRFWVVAEANRMETHRYVVEYERNGEGTEDWKAFRTLEEAKSFASTGIKNGKIWPMEARIWRQSRTSQYREWENDPEFEAVTVDD